jgi:UDP-glucose 4-epimerase
MDKIKKNILVIGGSGFMGSHTADFLSQQGALVTILDKIESPWLKSNQKMIIGDVMNSTTLNSAMKDIDFLYFFSGIADIDQARLKPYDTIEANIMGLTKALESAVNNKVKKIVYASTMYVYSQYGSFYRASKQAAEIIIEAYHENFGLDYVLLRYGSLYGARSQDWNGVRNFAEQIIKEGCLTYSGTGSEIREYINVEDAARLSVKMLNNQYNNKAITITGQQSISTADFFSMLFEIIGKKPNINYKNFDAKNFHYGNTPYRYKPQRAIKIIPTEYIDFGQGLLDLIDEITKESNS